LYWASTRSEGLFGAPIYIGKGTKPGSPDRIDLRSFPAWEGTITHLAIGFGSRGGEKLTLRSLAVEDNNPARPFLRRRHLDFTRGQVRAGQDAVVRLTVEHAGGPPLPAGPVQFRCDHDTAPAQATLFMPAVGPGGRAELRVPVKLPVQSTMFATIVSFTLPNEQSMTRALLVHEPVRDPSSLARPDGYDVPPPRPVSSDYQIGVYYFPGWSPEQASRWQKQAGFPERDSLLGWYEEGRPEVADWHIKWAVENGISFFLYDWYWRKDHEELTAGLNDGFLQARYRDRMKFALMWANHSPFAGHTPQQLLTVAAYWIEHYFRRPNYLLVDGKPYVSFFAPHELLSDLGSPEKVWAALDAMRQLARGAGLPGIHFGACAGGDPGVLRGLNEAGFDSVSGYNYRRIGSTMLQAPYLPYMLAHEPVWKAMSSAGPPQYIPLLTTGWDSRPWHGPRAEAQFDRSVGGFAEGLRLLKAHLDRTGGKLAILEAWNEWGEGSYIEPNTEFGFGDLESIRRTFAGTTLQDNICPADVGLEGRYDIRRKLVLVGKHSDIRSGMELICRDHEVAVMPGVYSLRGQDVAGSGGVVQVPPAETVEIKDLPMTLVAGRVNTWRDGNRLIISLSDRRHVLPGSYVPGSLVIRDPARPTVAFKPGRDYEVDDTWGAFAVFEGGTLKAGDKIMSSYRISLRRVDALVLGAGGKPQLVRGAPLADCPLLPAVPAGTVRVANIYRPFGADQVLPVQVYVPRAAPPPPPAENTAVLEPVVDKLRSGKPVTIVCWGDSVTSCGESSSPATCYVGLLESMLKQRFPRSDLKVINAGIGGSSTPGRFPGFQKEVLDFHPDVVTLEFVNDMGVPAAQMASMYDNILRRTREAGAVLVIMTPHFTMPAWMGLPDGRGRGDPRPNVAFLRRFARENRVPLADAARRWEELEDLGVPYEILLRNGINHPEDRGHRLFAEELLRLFPE
jgi:lysophospholipase L1-like esterase